MFALSVSISAISSPTATSSPTCFIQVRIVPSSIESERRGIAMSCAVVWAISVAPLLYAGGDLGRKAQSLGDLVDDTTLGWHPGVVELMQALGGDHPDQVGGPAADRRSLLDRDDAVGLGDGSEDGGEVERA